MPQSDKAGHGDTTLLPMKVGCFSLASFPAGHSLSLSIFDSTLLNPVFRQTDLNLRPHFSVTGYVFLGKVFNFLEWRDGVGIED